MLIQSCGVEIRNDGTICGQRLEVFNITSVNITKQTITILENLIILGNIIPSLDNTYSLGSPDLVWKDLYLGDNSLYLGNYILDVFDGNFRIRNETTNIMYFNQTANEMVFTTNTRTIGFAEGASPLKLREGVQFFNVDGVKFSSTGLFAFPILKLLSNVVALPSAPKLITNGGL